MLGGLPFAASVATAGLQAGELPVGAVPVRGLSAPPAMASPRKVRRSAALLLVNGGMRKSPWLTRSARSGPLTVCFPASIDLSVNHDNR